MATGRWKRWWRFGWTVSAIVILSAVVMTLGWVSESAAQGPDQWEFRGFFSSGVVSPFVRRDVLVSGDGSFSLANVPCPGGGAFDVAGRMSDTVTGTVTGRGGCSPLLSRPGRLAAAFPAATAFDNLEITLGDGSIVTIAGRLIVKASVNPVRGALDLGDVAVLTTSVQNRNIGLRLSSLRSGLGGGPSVGGLSFSVKGDSVPIGSVLAGMLSGGGASADPGQAFGRLGIFANGLGSFGDRDATPQGSGYDFYTAGLTMGADYRFTDQLILGAAFGYLRTKIDRASAPADSAINGYSLSAYGTYYLKERFYVDGILTYGRNDYSIARQASNPIDPARLDRITARTDGDQLSASASAGYDFTAGGLTFGPTGRVTYIHVHIDGFTERGPAGSSAATIGDQTVESLATAVGAQATYAISTPWGVLLPLVRAEWEHELKGNRRVLAGSLVSDPATLLTAQTDAPDRDYFNVGVGVSATFKRGVSAFVHYEESLGRSSFTNHSFTGGIKFEF